CSSITRTSSARCAARTCISRCSARSCSASSAAIRSRRRAPSAAERASAVLLARLAVLVEVEDGRDRAFGEQAEAARDFLIGFHLAAEVAAEAVLVQLLVRGDVPQAAAV